MYILLLNMYMRSFSKQKKRFPPNKTWRHLSPPVQKMQHYFDDLHWHDSASPSRTWVAETSDWKRVRCLSKPTAKQQGCWKGSKGAFHKQWLERSAIFPLLCLAVGSATLSLSLPGLTPAKPFSRSSSVFATGTLSAPSIRWWHPTNRCLTTRS